MPTTPPYQLDTTTGQRRFSQAAAGYDSAAVLQDLVRTELLDRLEVVQLQPTVVLDLGCGTGKGSAALLARYAPLQPLKERAKSLLGLAPKPPQARVIGIDSAPGMLAAAAAHVRANPLGELLAADACALPFPAAYAELVFASLLLPWIADPDALFAEVRRVLRPGGRIVLLEVTSAQGAIAAPLFRFTMRHVAPTVGVLASGRISTFPMMRYWADTIEDAVRPAVIVSALELAGFIGVRHATELGVMSYYRGVSRR